MDFKNTSGSLNLLRQNHKNTKRKRMVWTCRYNIRRGHKEGLKLWGTQDKSSRAWREGLEPRSCRDILKDTKRGVIILG